MLEGAAVRHQCRGGQDTPPVCFHNAVVHIASKPEIIRIDNESAIHEKKLEQPKLDSQELFGIGPEVFH